MKGDGSEKGERTGASTAKHHELLLLASAVMNASPGDDFGLGSDGLPPWPHTLHSAGIPPAGFSFFNGSTTAPSVPLC
jgi:hypothetical protein